MEFEIYRDNAGEYRWRLASTNGNILADSGESYKNRIDCIDQVTNIKELAKAATIRCDNYRIID